MRRNAEELIREKINRATLFGTELKQDGGSAYDELVAIALEDDAEDEGLYEDTYEELTAIGREEFARVYEQLLNERSS